MKNLYITIILLMCFFPLLQSQSSFYNATQDFMGNTNVHSTICVGVDDINGDRKDDLILLHEGKFLQTIVQNGESTIDNLVEHTQISAFGDWALVTGDLNNDGNVEVICSGTENGSEILFLENGKYTARQFTTPIYSQNTNLVDFNDDGFLDLFVCNDEGRSKTYFNDGDGKFNNVDLIDFQVSPNDDMSGNYSSIFTDIDGDGDLDLYIGKCRAGVTDSMDPRRVNTLYINQGDGSYVEAADDFGLAIGAQTWSVDAGDVDNDGDMDLIVANHDRTHDLMINNGPAGFTRFPIAEDIKNFAYQSFFGDFDNNGWLDIFITEPSKGYILYNDSMSFFKRSIRIGGRSSYSGSTGDFNSDGNLDLYLTMSNGFQSPGSQRDVVYLNEGTENNFIDINLEGTESNRDGIGAKVFVYNQNRLQLREIHAGKSYGIMTSTVAHFGLGQIAVVDSIVIEWPSGQVSKLIQPIEVNQKITIQEGGCITSRIFIPQHEICNASSVEIILDNQYDSYLWSDGSTGNTLVVSEPGSYSVMVKKDGCAIESNIFEVKEIQNYEQDEIITTETLIGCSHEAIKLSASAGRQYTWSTGETSQSIYIDTPGVYFVFLETNCASFLSESLDISFKQLEEPELMGDTVDLGGEAELFVEGGDVGWYQSIFSESPLSTANEFKTVPLFDDSTFYAQYRETGNDFNIKLMEIVPLNNGSDDQFSLNDTLDFTVFQELQFNSFQVRTQVEGNRVFELYRKGQLIKEMNILCNSGVNTINLEMRLSPDNYSLTTNADTNVVNLGVSYPKFSFADLYFENDKRIKGYLKVGESKHYTGITPYFFNWNLDYGYYSCAERYAVHAVVRPLSIQEEQLDVSIYPNPSSGALKIESPKSRVIDLIVYTVYGEKIKEMPSINSEDILKLDLESGVYFIELKSKLGRKIQKLSIIR